jgi:hypothetical protein
LPLHRLEATVQIVLPAIMHQVMVTKVLSQVYTQPEIDKGKVKAAAIVCVNGVHAAQGPEQVTSGCLVSDKLNQVIRTIKSQIDADNGYFVVKRA